MSKPLNEVQVLKTLNIPDFRHITKDKVMSFASMLQNMEPEVAKKALEQFPEFAHMALEALHDYKAVMDKALDSNDKSSEACYKIYNEIISALTLCLHKDNISFEEKQYYIDKMMEIAKMAGTKDTENKRFNWGVLGAIAGGVVVVLGISAAVLGGNTNISIPWKKS